VFVRLGVISWIALVRAAEKELRLRNPNSNLNLTYTGAASFGTCPAGRWIVAGGDIATGAQFNVMVVNP
jgi:hypothetical protein